MKTLQSFEFASLVSDSSEPEHYVCCQIPIGFIGETKSMCGKIIFDEMKPGDIPDPCIDCDNELDDFQARCPDNRYHCPNNFLGPDIIF